ncbi:hypothetical protein EG856_02375 [Mycoplasmopsis phocirhinis]|uniref:Uncharacterized protein n=1 Tax=Mycoplasmopsis phocirhinis TaxID=142650 RepID=A0A4P6MSC2_9BACT|nr:hypothetical protein [Mycoplasmopsis phocirhinis]QBF34751.1 hypothetical protein EG856_02375 [Mycoplasmopsis phocirhinis]
MKIGLIGSSTVAAFSWLGALFFPKELISFSITSTTVAIGFGAALTGIRFIKDVVYSFNNMENDTTWTEFLEDAKDLTLNIIMSSKVINFLKKKLPLFSKTKITETIDILSNSETIRAFLEEETLNEIYKNILKIWDVNKMLHKINNHYQHILGKLSTMKEQFNWAVINETEQYGKYTEQGFGGKNLIFKNMQTGEIKPLEYFLNFDNTKLRLWNLIKIKDKSKGWYIRTLPNNIKRDNLG